MQLSLPLFQSIDQHAP